MKGVFLDDIREPSHVTWLAYPRDIEWVVVRDAKGFRKAINTYLNDPSIYDLFSFDHDLGLYDSEGVEINGFHLARELFESVRLANSKMPTIVVHSKNSIGAKNILDVHSFYVKYANRDV